MNLKPSNSFSTAAAAAATTTTTTAFHIPVRNAGTFQSACYAVHSASFRTSNSGNPQHHTDYNRPQGGESSYVGLNRIQYRGSNSRPQVYRGDRKGRRMWNGFRAQHPHGFKKNMLPYDLSDPNTMYPSNTYYDRPNYNNRINDSYSPEAHERLHVLDSDDDDDSFRVVGGHPSAPHAYPWLVRRK